MKLDVMRPEMLVDIGDVRRTGPHIDRRGDTVYVGAETRMAEAAGDPDLQRDYPLVVQSLDLAASPQIRNMATLGGNVLQRTRCSYFRDPSWSACNKRDPGSGCAALDGINRKHAVLGISDQCIAAYPGDFAQALIALDALVEIAGGGGIRLVPFAQLHRAPGDTPHIETILAPGDLITGFALPVAPWTRRSVYVKVRDRESYEFALASAAVALDLAVDGTVNGARIALGGVATKPWRAREAEAALAGKHLDQGTARQAAEIAFAGAETRNGNAYKPELGKRTLVRALLQASELSI
jgi:xanthine dehydrogenase YagS FAD-binding subunit